MRGSIPLITTLAFVVLLQTLGQTFRRKEEPSQMQVRIACPAFEIMHNMSVGHG